MLVDEVDPVPSEVDRFFVRFGLAVRVELLLGEIVLGGFDCLGEALALHAWATVAKEIDLFSTDLVDFSHHLSSDEIGLPGVGQNAYRTLAAECSLCVSKHFSYLL